MLIGFARDTFYRNKREQAENLRTRDGLKTIYVDGDGGENLEEALRPFKRPNLPEKVLCIDSSLVLFGRTQKEIEKALKPIKAAGIVIWDREHDERSDRDGIEMQRRAAQEIQYGASMHWDRKIAAKRGKKGGKAKKTEQAKKREGIAQDSVIRRLVAARGQVLTWDLVIWILQGDEKKPFSKSTLIRHYDEK